MSTITQNTLIPLGVAVLVIGSATAWVTQVNIAVDAHASKIEEATKREESRYLEFVTIARSIELRLSSIEWELKKRNKNGKGND